MIWFIFQKIGFFIFLFLTLKFVFQKKYESLLVLYFFGLVFGSCFYFAVTIWSPSKVVSMGMLISMLNFKGKKRKIPIIKSITLILMLLIIVSDIIALLLPGSLYSLVSPLQRLLIQNFGYITAAILLSYGSILKGDFVKRIFPKYCVAVEIAIITGLIHYLCNKVGIEFAPILRTDGVNENSEVVANFGGSIVQRIYGFAGEPKNLGFLIAPYLVMSFFSYFSGILRISQKYHLTFLVLGFFTVFQTYSSSAMLTVILSIGTLFLFYKIKIGFNLLSAVVIILGCFFSYNLLHNAFTSKNNDEGFLTALENRTFGRAQDELENDRQEVIIWNTFEKDQLVYQIFGYGIGQYTFHIPNQMIGNRIIPVQSGVILTLVDFGLLGILFFISFGGIIIVYLIRSRKNDDTLSSCIFILAFVTYIGGLLYGNLFTSFMLFMLAIYNFYDSNQNLNHKFKNAIL